jgi:hypothetical protein
VLALNAGEQRQRHIPDAHQKSQRRSGGTRDARPTVGFDEPSQYSHGDRCEDRADVDAAHIFQEAEIEAAAHDPRGVDAAYHELPAGRQPEHYDTSKSVASPFGLRQLWTEEQVLKGNN